MTVMIKTLVVLYLLSLGIVAGRMLQVAFLNWRNGQPMFHWSWGQTSLAVVMLVVPAANTVFAVSALRHMLEDR
jgi:hypothetical protein